MDILFPIIQEMDSYLYKLDISDDQDCQTELPNIGYYDIDCHDIIIDIDGRQTGCIFCDCIDCKEIGEQY